MTQQERIKTRDRLKAELKVCQICGSDMNLTIDHIIPVSEGGADDESNFTLLCSVCNSRKGPVPPLRQRIANLFNGNFYWFKTEIRANVRGVVETAKVLRDQTINDTKSLVGEFRKRIENLEGTNKILIEKITQLENQNKVIAERIRGFQDYHKLEWVESETKGYKKIKNAKAKTKIRNKT